MKKEKDGERERETGTEQEKEEMFLTRNIKKNPHRSHFALEQNGMIYSIQLSHCGIGRLGL